MEYSFNSFSLQDQFSQEIRNLSLNPTIERTVLNSGTLFLKETEKEIAITLFRSSLDGIQFNETQAENIVSLFSKVIMDTTTNSTITRKRNRDEAFTNTSEEDEELQRALKMSNITSDSKEKIPTTTIKNEEEDEELRQALELSQAIHTEQSSSQGNTLFYQSLIELLKNSFFSHVDTIKNKKHITGGHAYNLKKYFDNISKQAISTDEFQANYADWIRNNKHFSQKNKDCLIRELSAQISQLGTAENHDGHSWKSSLDRLNYSKKFDEAKKMRKLIWEQTERATTRGFIVDGKKFFLDDTKIDLMKQGTLLFVKPSSINTTIRYQTTVIVKNQDTLDAVLDLKSQGLNPVGQNMANESHAGGGYKNGSAAQEESLFRRTNYYQSLELDANAHLRTQMKGNYRIPEFGNVYTPALQMFRENEASGYKFCSPKVVDMIAIAGYDVKHHKSVMTKSFADGMKEKIRSFFRTAYHTGHNAVVVGAISCGAFGASPYEVSKLYKEVLQENEFKGAFKTIVFAIIDDHNGTNLKIFQDTFRN